MAKDKKVSMEVVLTYVNKIYTNVYMETAMLTSTEQPLACMNYFIFNILYHINYKSSNKFHNLYMKFAEINKSIHHVSINSKR